MKLMINREEVENIVLAMADIVLEKRALQQCVSTLEKENDMYRRYFSDACERSEKGVKDALKISLECMTKRIEVKSNDDK